VSDDPAAEPITRRDVESGRVGDLTLPNGVVVPAGLRISGESLAAHRARLSATRSPFTAEDAAASGYRPDEIAEVFRPRPEEPRCPHCEDTGVVHLQTHAGAYEVPCPFHTE
jgi:hypothetical protein